MIGKVARLPRGIQKSMYRMQTRMSASSSDTESTSLQRLPLQNNFKGHPLALGVHSNESASDASCEGSVAREIGASVVSLSFLVAFFWVLWGQVPGAHEAEAISAVTAATPADGFSAVFQQALNRAFKGGVAGFSAGVLQVGIFMWLRTSMNYQYANGGNLQSSLSTLYKQGGIARFYQGVGFAVVQAPLSRFGDTAANAGVLLLLEVYYPDLPIAIKSFAASGAAAVWRIGLTPIDTLKTTRQVQGPEAYDILMAKVKKAGYGVLFAGALGNFAASWVGNYPWFAVYNYLQETVPAASGMEKLVRNAVIGFCASSVSDTVSNSLRVLKTVRQTNRDENVGYFAAGKAIVETDGWKGLFGRGLPTRLLTNGLQGTFFSVVWKAIEENLLKQ
eukprot:CAMPEP_0198225024 /NCGR_PEP_ID=MMETSP1445-20131203/99367_1 /TAXON_ID=36898 /ORGANISM="Pyramimonas sp., Strain CCMP2087" /LENGTH=390 /DNA_ID=CAMNT_0043904399 /DNA_START=248 /DNA_END=1420 /DNA_ORIENTATION=+